MKNNNLEKGVAIYLVVIIVSALSAVSLNIASIIIGGSKLVSNYADSVKSFYAADTGIEHALYNCFYNSSDLDFDGSIGGDSKYYYSVTIDGNCSSPTIMASKGEYRIDGTNPSSSRKISISY